MALAVVGFNVSGNYCLSLGMRHMDGMLSLSPMAYLRALANPWVLGGVVLLISWLVAQLALLSWADLSYVLPVTAVGYVFVALVGKVLLNEQITTQRWAGIGLIVAGVALVGGGSAPQTAHPRPQAGRGQ